MNADKKTAGPATQLVAGVGWVERSDIHHAFTAMGIGLDGLNPSYTL